MKTALGVKSFSLTKIKKVSLVATSPHPIGWGLFCFTK